MFVHCQHSNPARAKAECGYCGRSACVFERGLVNELDVLQPEELKPEWHDMAACRDMEPEVFFDLRSPRNRRVALRTCAGCLIRDVCLEENLDTEFGIFGGLTPDQRRKYVAKHGVMRECIECGSGFRAHGLQRVCSDECRKVRHLDACRRSHRYAEVDK